ncbi:MAG: rhodanese-like domain-containing protein [Saprospiraceae bacterium]|nr:rhodanese-like domain-containing protein [Saprospiraceae bacterium]
MEVKEKAKEICPTTTLGRVQQGALLVDVREKEEVAELAYDVPNIMNIPLSIFEENFTQIPQDREVIMVCRSGGRSLKASYFLMNHGYTHVINMQHGMLRWAEKGFPTKGSVQVQNTQSGECCSPSATPTNSSCCSPKSDGSSCC